MTILKDSIKKQLIIDKIITWQNKSMLGKKLFTQENNILNDFSSRLAGNIAIQLSFNNASNLDKLSKFIKIYNFSITDNNQDNVSSIVDPNSLPVIPNIIDLVIMQHILEIYQNPRVIIKEISQILMPSGKLLLSGFNPISLVNLIKPMNKTLKELFSGINFIKVADLCEMLAEYDLEIEDIKYNGFLWSSVLHHSYLGKKIENLLTSQNISAGFCYTILASKKNYCPVTKSNLLNNLKNGIYPNGVANPSLGSTFKN